MKQPRFLTPASLIDRRVDIVVAGAGGTGGEFLDGLAQMQKALTALGHPGFRVRVFDPDTVSRSNIGRQRFTESDVGAYKVDQLVQRINLFHGLQWEAYPDAYELQDTGPMNLLVTCVDLASVRAQIGRAASDSYLTHDALWLDFGNGRDRGQYVLGHLDPACTRRGVSLPNVYSLHPELAEVDDNDAPSCSMEEALANQDWPINRLVAGCGLELLWTLFRYGGADYHGGHVQLNPLKFSPLKVDEDVWSLYGFTPSSEVDDEQSEYDTEL